MVDNDGSETLSITISGVPAGAVLSAGTETPEGSGIYTLTVAELENLTITPPKDSSDDFTMEDYAIIKYLSLRRLGFPEEDLRVVAVKDLNLKVGHAVLIVFWADPKTGKKRSLLLDNQIKKVVASRSARHYQPVFSINKDYWWRHRS